MAALCEHCSHPVGMTTSSTLYHVRGKPGEEAEFSTTCWECGCRYPKMKDIQSAPHFETEERCDAPQAKKPPASGFSEED